MALSRVTKGLAGIAAAAALLWLAFRGLDPAHLGSTLAAMDMGWAAAACLLAAASYLVRAWRWGTLLEPLARVRPVDLVSATLLGYAAGLVVPRSGELLRPWLISRRYPVRLAMGLGVIVIERVLDLVAVLAWLAGYLFLWRPRDAEAAGPLMAAVETGATVAAAVALPLLAALWLVKLRIPGDGPADADAGAPPPPASLRARLRDALGAAMAGLAVLRHGPPRRLAWVAAQSLGVWALLAAGFHAANLAVGIALPAQASLLMLALLTVGAFIPTPGLVGGFHAFYVLGLTGVFGVDRHSAAAASVIAHLATSVPALAGGFAFLGREGLTARNMLNPPQRG